MRACGFQAQQCAWIAGALLIVAAAGALACQAERIDAKAWVVKVYDGDTVRLADGRRVRMIGLDTPELGHDGEPDQPYAQQAAAALAALLAQYDEQVLIRYDIEQRDHYGRWLAHLYLPDKRSITAHLLRLGMATHLTVPPDTFASACYRRAEARARAAHTGIWRLPQYQIIGATALDTDARGFHRVRGRIVRVGYSRSALWLNLEGDVALRIERADLGYFPQQDFSALQGKEVVARGWLYEHNGELRMQIRHPDAIEAVH